MPSKKLMFWINNLEHGYQVESSKRYVYLEKAFVDDDNDKNHVDEDDREGKSTFLPSAP